MLFSWSENGTVIVLVKVPQMQLSCITKCISYCSCCYSQTPDTKQLLGKGEGFILAYDSEECSSSWHGRDGGRNGLVCGPG